MAFYHDPHAPDDLQWTSVLSGCPSAGKSVEIPVLNDHFWLVVDLPLWKMMEFVSWDYDIPNIWKHRKCSKSPTRFSMGISYMPCLNSSIFCLVFYIQKKTATNTNSIRDNATKPARKSGPVIQTLVVFPVSSGLVKSLCSLVTILNWKNSQRSKKLDLSNMWWPKICKDTTHLLRFDPDPVDICYVIASKMFQ